MSIRTKNTFAWLWIAALLTATIGVSVQQMYCYCLGKTTISLFSSGEGCQAEKKTARPDCCSRQKKKTSSCCAKGADAAEKSHGCTKKSTKVFQMKTEFVVDNPFEKSLDGPLWQEEFPLYRHFFRPVICETTFFNKAPPPLSGREICLRNHFIRC